MSRLLTICNEIVLKLKQQFPSMELSLVPRFEEESCREKIYLVPHSETVSDLSGSRLVEQKIEIGVYHNVDTFSNEQHFDIVESLIESILGLDLSFCCIQSVNVENQFFPEVARDRVLLSVISVVCVYGLKD